MPPDESPLFPPTPPPPPRTAQKILLEAIFFGVIGLIVVGIFAEVGLLHVGWAVAVIIWVAGPAVLELIQTRHTRRGGR
jgi:hypothetical protein